MKNKFLLIVSALLTLAVSCNEAGNLDQPGVMGELSINIAVDGCSMTKAAYTAETAAEKKITEVQLLIFHDDGSLAYYRNLGTSTSQDKISLVSGRKTVWAVANAGDLSKVKSLSDLEAIDIELAAHNDPGTDFVMAGSNTVNVGEISAVNVVMSRFVSRIVLNKVTNSLPSAAGTLTVNNAFLSNVVGNQTLADVADSPSDWYNQMGRETDAASSSAIIDGSGHPASAPALTFSQISRSVSNGSSLAGVPYLFYSYPNTTGSDLTGWSGNFSPRFTRLVVTASFGGNRYYYPVTVAGPTSRNNTYTVEMTITGPGSDDPDKPVSKDSFSATVTVQSWQGNTVYTETF